MTIWLLDLEGDPVDLDMRWSAAGVDGDQVATQAGNGHGRVGLMTRRGRLEPNGQAHELTWSVDGVPIGEEIRLSFTPTDQQGHTGETVIT
ncbi:MAG: hypothetical protein VX475_01665, partial [Myxococcota bacterium]|nr:hypothetical protein [Myxococcota bacterium]